MGKEHWSEYDLVNVLTGETRVMSWRSLKKQIGDPEVYDILEVGMYGDWVVAPSLTAREIKG